MTDKKTNLDECKNIAKVLVEVDVRQTEVPLILSHPWFQSPFFNIMSKDNDYEIINILDSEENMKKAKEFIYKIIERANNIHQIYMLMNKNYRSLYFKLVNGFLSKDDYNDFLSFVWTDSENPNQDPNVSISKWVSFFKKADKTILMSPDEYKVYNDLMNQKEITIYRGVSKGRENFGLSWTCNKHIATWFASRFYDEGDNAYIIKAKVKPDAILAYFNCRKEDEVVINIKKIYDVNRIGFKVRKKDKKRLY